MDLAAAYHQSIVRIMALTGGDDAVLHIHCGLAIYFGAQIVLRDRRASFAALMLVILLEGANEIMDRLYAGSWRWPDTSRDIVNTLFWPVTIFLVQRYRRHHWRQQADRRFREARALFDIPRRRNPPPPACAPTLV